MRYRRAHAAAGSFHRRRCSCCKNFLAKSHPDRYCKRCRRARRGRADPEVLVREARWGGQLLPELLKSASRRP